jgi:hypothetical protein
MVSILDFESWSLLSMEQLAYFNNNIVGIIDVVVLLKDNPFRSGSD